MKLPARDGLSFAVFLLCILLTAWLGIAGPLVKDANENLYQAFKDFQPLIAACLAAVGIYVAWRNVSRQLSQGRDKLAIDLMSREEDRIERDFPGLESAINFLARFQLALDMRPDHLDYKDAIQDEKLLLEQDDMKAEIEKRLPATDAKTRLEITQVMNLVVFRANQLSNAISYRSNLELTQEELDDARKKVARSGDFMDMALRDLSQLINGINHRITVYRMRLPRFRERIERSLEEL